MRWWPLDALPAMSELMLTRIGAALSDEREARFVAPPGQPEPVEVLVPDHPVLGVDACPGGWVGVVLDRDLRASVFMAPTIVELATLVRETHDVAVVAIDIPIGLPDSSGRVADAEARRVLVGKSSSVFSTPVRAALEADTYAEGRAANLAATDGRTSVSAQAYALREKVLQVDAWVRSRPGVAVIEVHPEVSFARMAGAPVLTRKKDADGVAARRRRWRATASRHRTGSGERASGRTTCWTPVRPRGRRSGTRSARASPSPARRRSSPTASRPRSGPERRAQPECVVTP